MNPCEHNVAVLKGQGFLEKHHARYFVNFLRRKVKIMKFKALPHLPEEMSVEAKDLDKTKALIS